MLSNMEDTSSRKVFKLDDSLIAQIAQIVQLAIVTQTNIVDHMRQLRLEESKETSSSLVLTPEYVEFWDSSIKRMMEQVEALKAEEGMELEEKTPGKVIVN